MFPTMSSCNCYVRSATLSLYFKIAIFLTQLCFNLQNRSCCNRICTCSLGTSSVSLDNMSCKREAEETSFFSFDFYLVQTLSLHIKKHGSLQSWSNNIAKKKQIHASLQCYGWRVFFYPWLWAGPLDRSYCLCDLFSYTMEYCLQRD